MGIKDRQVNLNIKIMESLRKRIHEYKEKKGGLPIEYFIPVAITRFLDEEEKNND